MKAIIDDLLYDTETATLIYTDENKNRRWYLAVNGHYFVAFLNGQITPKTEEQVKEFLGVNDPDKYIELFGEPEEA